MARLKVFRTPIGFHDAYVAAPSRKAALAAWGSDADLFARGVAEEVTDAALTEEPLARPGTVIRLSRGTAAEQIAALPKSRPKRKPAPDPLEELPKRSAAKPPRAKVPKPDRSSLKRAEEALHTAEARHDRESRELAREAAALQRRRRDFETRQAKDIDRLKRALEAERAAYDKALRGWNG